MGVGIQNQPREKLLFAHTGKAGQSSNIALVFFLPLNSVRAVQSPQRAPSPRTRPPAPIRQAHSIHPSPLPGLPRRVFFRAARAHARESCLANPPKPQFPGVDALGFNLRVVVPSMTPTTAEEKTDCFLGLFHISPSVHFPIPVPVHQSATQAPEANLLLEESKQSVVCYGRGISPSGRVSAPHSPGRCPSRFPRTSSGEVILPFPALAMVEVAKTEGVCRYLPLVFLITVTSHAIDLDRDRDRRPLSPVTVRLVGLLPVVGSSFQLASHPALAGRCIHERVHDPVLAPHLPTQPRRPREAKGGVA